MHKIILMSHDFFSTFNMVFVFIVHKNVMTLSMITKTLLPVFVMRCQLQELEEYYPVFPGHFFQPVSCLVFEFLSLCVYIFQLYYGENRLLLLKW